ncbi:Protein of uncharacterised function (DUF3298) [Actinobacillus pleuropneumoniae]|nr:Protein of uncharacterised function (DUF3298) [Actinobacillus pleuropneumoniae]
MGKGGFRGCGKCGAERLHMHPYQLTITYELTSDGSDDSLISLKVITEGMGMNNGDPRVDTYNFTNEAEARRVTLEDLFGKNYKSIVDTAVKTAIAADQDHYFANEDGFQGIGAEHPSMSRTVQPTSYSKNTASPRIHGNAGICREAAGYSTRRKAPFRRLEARRLLQG